MDKIGLKMEPFGTLSATAYNNYIGLAGVNHYEVKLLQIKSIINSMIIE